MEKFKSSEESNFFTSGEEIRLLLHTIQATPYDTVSVGTYSISIVCVLPCVSYGLIMQDIEYSIESLAGTCGNLLRALI